MTIKNDDVDYKNIDIIQIDQWFFENVFDVRNIQKNKNVIENLRNDDNFDKVVNENNNRHIFKIQTCFVFDKSKNSQYYESLRKTNNVKFDKTMNIDIIFERNVTKLSDIVWHDKRIIKNRKSNEIL